MDENGFNSLTHSVKCDGKKNKRAHRLLLLGYILFAIAYIVLVTVPVQLWPALGGLPFLLLVFVKITWWRLDYDIEYSLSGGELRVERIYSASRRREMVRLRVKDASAIGPVGEIHVPKSTPITDLRGTSVGTDDYCIVYRNSEGKECAIYIELSTKLIKTIAKFNPATVIAEAHRV